jgi:predicted RNA-binding Zn-ribbon protein involved in translation (DUF1610 family)
VSDQPIPMRLTCPECRELHIDEGEFATRVHHTHSCQNCGLTWRPAVVPTVGVRFLPGFKNGDVPRCTVCHWPLSPSVEAGCVPGNCSLRPRARGDKP